MTNKFYYNKPKKGREIKITHDGKEYDVKVSYKEEICFFLPSYPEDEELAKKLKTVIVKGKSDKNFKIYIGEEQANK